MLYSQAMNYSPELFQKKLESALKELASTGKFLVGLSGGLDSVVLLHALVKLRALPESPIELRALHINHQLQQEADQWERHCLALCAELEVECASIKVKLEKGAGVENAARDARYKEFSLHLAAGEELLLAHHRDDQMETLLLRLMRGSGVRGLSAMPRSRKVGANKMLRPLLDFDREELRGYARAEALSWMEDGSNADDIFDRNYCRHRILPLIQERWPSYRESWSKSIVLAGESAQLIQELAAMDLADVVAESDAVLKRGELLALSEPRRRNVLQHWLAGLDAPELGWNQLQRLSNEVVSSNSGEFDGEGFRVTGYRDRIYLLSLQSLGIEPEAIDLKSVASLFKSGEVLLPNNGRLRIQAVEGEGVSVAKLHKPAVAYRQGGETCRLAGRPTKTLKKILQELDVPPWVRGRVPMLFDGADLAYVPGAGVCEGVAAERGEPGYLIEWEQPDLALRR